MVRRRPTPVQARERRSKRLAVGLGAVLVVVSIVQVPRLLKQLNPPKPAENAGSGLVAAPNSASSQPAGVAAADASGQLPAVLRLALKDPFHVLVAAGTSTSSSGTPVTTMTTASEQPAAPPAKVATGSSAGPALFTTAPLPGAAEIEMNGERQLVAVGNSFPKAQPLFELVSVANKRIRIGLATGSFLNGQSVLTVTQGHEVTLVDQNGSHYVLDLLRLTDAPKTPTSAAG